MNRLLQLTTYGIKNIEKEIVIDFSNSTIERGIKKVNNVKGIFGYNGAGKSALITAVDFYKNIVCGSNFLMQNETKERLSKLINFKTNEFFISIVFEYRKDVVMKHSIKLSKNDISHDYIISEEVLSLLVGRTLNDKYKELIRKENKTIIADELSGIEYLKAKELDYNSFIQVILKELLDKSNGDKLKVSQIENYALDCFSFASNIEVDLQVSDMHNNYFINRNAIKKLLVNDDNSIGTAIDNWISVYVDDDTVSKEEFEQYKKDNKKLERFIRIFKPELKEIRLDTQEDKNLIHIRKTFVYDEYNVEYEFESSGIKQLVKLFSYLLRCANGSITFIDEIDANINAVYFEKLISYYRQYGEGQLIFTTHNLEAMKALKSQSRSIAVLGVDGKVDIWVKEGNRSPIADYVSGAFPNSPMNVEDFDFINIFSGE